MERMRDMLLFYDEGKNLFLLISSVAYCNYQHRKNNSIKSLTATYLKNRWIYYR